MPSDFALKTMNAVHRAVLKISAGRVGWSTSKMPVLELTTTGRKTGRDRSVMLTSPVQDGTTLVVVASRGGDDNPPAWLLNLQDDPDVGVRLGGGSTQRMTARVATADERSSLWPRVVADHKHYAEYQTRTAREIALVLLEPVA